MTVSTVPSAPEAVTASVLGTPATVSRPSRYWPTDSCMSEDAPEFRTTSRPDTDTRMSTERVTYTV